MVPPNFRKYVEEYHAPPFYKDMVQLKAKYEFMRES